MITISNEQAFQQVCIDSDLIAIKLFNLHNTAELKIKNIAKQLYENNIKDINELKKHKHLFILPNEKKKLFLKIQNQSLQIIELELNQCPNAPLWNGFIAKKDFIYLLKDLFKKTHKHEQEKEHINKSSSQHQLLKVSSNAPQSVTEASETKYYLNFVICEVTEVNSGNKIFTKNFQLALPKNFDISKNFFISVIKCNGLIQVNLSYNEAITGRIINVPKKYKLRLLSTTPNEFQGDIDDKASILKYLCKAVNNVSAGFEKIFKVKYYFKEATPMLNNGIIIILEFFLIFYLILTQILIF